ASAFAADNASAIAEGVASDESIASLIAASSTSAGTTSNVSPAASSIRRRKMLADARTSRRRGDSAIGRIPSIARGRTFLAIVQQANDRCCGLLDGAARHVDHGPPVPGA